MGQKLGDAANPLLVSVRSGAKFSMPGMMNTILNLGLNDETTAGLAKKTGNPRFAYDCYRRFIQMFGEVALDIADGEFDHIFDARKAKKKAKLDTDLTAEDLKVIVGDYKKLVQKETGKPFPQDRACAARAVARRRVPLAGGHRTRNYYRQDGKDSRRYRHGGECAGDGVRQHGRDFGHGRGFHARSRHRREGVLRRVPDERAGRRRGGRHPHAASDRRSAEAISPEAFTQLREITTNLEKHYKDMQDFEFTIQEGKLYMLQTRNGKRTGPAAVRIAVEMVEERLITKKEAVMRVAPAAARSAAASGVRSEDAEGPGQADDGHFGIARRGGGARGVHGGRSGRDGGQAAR